jgi:hypothetical protein
MPERRCVGRGQKGGGEGGWAEARKEGRWVEAGEKVGGQRPERKVGE